MSLISQNNPQKHRHLGRLQARTPGLGRGLGLALLMLGGLTGCPPDALTEQMMPGDVIDPGLDPQSLFDTLVKPEMTGASGSCNCHYTMQSTVAPFFAMGMEYQQITTYGMGKFLTAVPDMSLLLLKGMHIGPALTTDQQAKVRAWLSAEAATRGDGMSSPTTPTVPIRLGNFFLSLETLTMDPLASITFQLSQVSGTTYRISNMQLNAGPTGGIAIKHPRFIIFTANGATPEASDGLSTVDMTANANMSATIGTGNLLLTNLPASSARLALVFQSIAVVNPTMAMLKCKNLAAFDPPVKTQLQTCAALCHSPTGTDSRKTQATSAFNMAGATSTDPNVVGSLCVNTLARIDKNNPAASILVVQPEPQTMGGTPNHPYKITDANQFATYKNQIVTWASGEK